MDFRLNDDQMALQESARKFASEELPQVAEYCEKEDAPPPDDILKKYGEMGFLGINMAEEYGGMGLGNLEALIVLEEVAKISSAVAFPVFEANTGPAQAIKNFGSDEMKSAYLPKVVRGEMIVAVSMSEPAAGSALTDLTTKAEIRGDTIVINGAKRWCSGAGHSGTYVVYCRMSDDPGARGIGAVLVDKETPGLTFGKQEELMGFRGVPSADMFFDNVEVPVGNMIVGAGGFKQLMEAFDLERCGNATMALAQAQASLDDVVEYTQERKQFGKPIIDFQAVQISIAEMKMRTEAARLLIHRAAANAQDGLPSMIDSSLAKCFSNEITREVTGAALQLMGGYGYSKEYQMERRLRDAWGWGIAGGAIDIQKINITSAIVGRRFDQRR